MVRWYSNDIYKVRENITSQISIMNHILFIIRSWLLAMVLNIASLSLIYGSNIEF